MRGPGGPAGLQNQFATVMRSWRFDSPAFRFSSSQLSAVSKNFSRRVLVAPSCPGYEAEHSGTSFRPNKRGMVPMSSS